MSSRKATPRIKFAIYPPDTSPSAKSSLRKRGQTDNTINTAGTVLNLAADLSEASDILSPLKAACKATKTILDAIQAVKDNQEEWSDLTERLEEYMLGIERQIDSFEKYPAEDRVVDEAFRQPLIHYVELLEDIYSTVTNSREKRTRSTLSFFKAFTKVKMDAEILRKFNRDIEDGNRQLLEQLGLFTAYRIQVIEKNTQATKADLEVTKANVELTKVNMESTKADVQVTKVKVETILSDVDANAILQLPMVTFAASSVHNTCLQGTRQAVLQEIDSWAKHAESQWPIFWLCDIAGSGKSTVAMSVAKAWATEGTLGGQFFFSLSSSEGSTTEKFCSTIARELAQRMPELAQHIAESVKRNPALLRDSLHDQLRMLVHGPLQYRQGRVFLVIDAIDECKSGTQRKELLDSLAKIAQETDNLRIFITSRPDPVIEAVLRPLSIKMELKDRLHDVSHHDNIDDIATYVHQSLNGVLSQDKRERLVEKARGLFIWASTACRMLMDETSLDTPDTVYNRLISVNQAGDIDEVYLLIFERINPKFRPSMWHMLALLLAAFEPLTISDLEDLFKHAGIQGSVKALVQNLGSVLTEDDAVRFRHPTIVEYLRRCSTAALTNDHGSLIINMAKAHGQAASWCLKCLKSPNGGLKFNICQLESSFYLNRQILDLSTRVSKFITKRLRYASSHWLFHVAKTDDDWRRTLNNEIQRILQMPYVLYWMEVLSLTGGVPRAISGLRAVIRDAKPEEDIRNSLTEIRRLIMAFSMPIQDSAPHIYISVLPFTPKKSNIQLERLKEYPNTLIVAQGLEETSPGLPRALGAHNGSIYSVSFSPDSSRIVCGSTDKTIRIWDADTGQLLGEPLRGHENSVFAVAFSPDGSRIVSGSMDHTIRLWDADSGEPLGEPLRGHGSSVWAVSFSPDGLRIVSGSKDNTIRLWDADTGAPLGGPLVGHSGWVKAVIFSPDGSQIASSSDDCTIRMWDAKTGQPLGEPLVGHEDSVNAISFSPDGSRVVSGLEDGTMQIWDTETGRPLGESLRGHGARITAVAFSPDGSRIVSSSWDKTIRLWDADSGEQLGNPLRADNGPVNAFALSPDGSLIVSASGDTRATYPSMVHELQLWDAKTLQPLGDPLLDPLLDPHVSILTVTFSPDGSRILSCSGDGRMRLWDAGSGQLLGEPLGDSVWAAAFSPDGLRIVSGSGDSTIQLWDADAGAPLGRPLVGHDSPVCALAFSPDGLRIASGLEDGTVQLWDTETGQPLEDLLYGHNSIMKIQF
ncbi:related to WD40-repeat protein (notchless protein) [Serendipita indica DSM 11827]|uniref:Related to WD40-repeat protein (Notchless protein) n=1 Tax=Serendipita indica (strain DSM 11827) TaxID=1109443 RepID=G4TSD5_SERID|nr:related to WD40-repeat protein (notchless protein) [Serendipita indica DSM 11827]